MSEIKSGIYIIRNTIDERCYVGSAINLERRKRQHFNKLESNKNHCAHLQYFANKHGIDTLYFEVLEYVENKENLIEREQFYLDNTANKFNSLPIAGSNLGYKHSEESINKMKIIQNSKDVREKIIQTRNKPEVKEKISKAAKEVSARQGVKERKSKRLKELYQDESFREKMCEISKENWQNKERRDNLSQRNKRLWQDESHREKISQKMKEVFAKPEVKARMSKSIKEALARPEIKEKHSKSAKEMWQDPEYIEKIKIKRKEVWQDETYRKKMSIKAKEKMASPEAKEGVSKRFKKLWENKSFRKKVTDASIEAVGKRVYQYDLEKTKLIAVYRTAKEVFRKTKIHVGACVRGKCKQAGGYFWSYTPLDLPTKSKKKIAIPNQLNLFLANN